MGAFMGAFVSAVVGGVLAAGAVFGLVNSMSSVPPPVDAPYIVYGTS